MAGDIASSSWGIDNNGIVWFVCPLYIFRVMVGFVFLDEFVSPKCLVNFVFKHLAILNPR